MDEREKIEAALKQGSKAFSVYFRSELRKALDSGKGRFGTRDTEKTVVDFIADALIAANIGDVTALKERAGSEIKSCYKEIAEKRDETAKLRKQLKRTQNAAKKQKRRAEVAERALATVCEEVLHARYPVESVTASVVDAFIQRTLKEAEKELAEEDKK